MSKQLRRVVLLALVGLSLGITMVSAQQQPEKKLGWYLSAQTYTFNRFTFFEAVDKTLSAGLKSVEAYPGQQLGGGMGGVMDYKMDAAKRKAILKALKKEGVKLCAFGVVNGSNEAEWTQIFEFAKAMGIKVINTEPSADAMQMIGRLANRYKIKVGIHNHPKPSHYWSPQAVLDAVAAADSKYVGACADIGHWVRSGLDPVESLKKYDGHLVSLHFKDLSEKSASAHDVHWGTGVCNVEAVIAELKRQGFKGNISAEYEHNWEDNAGDVKQSVVNFRNILTSH
ncbi:sugar phosphate isomerase/epimerase family protein [Parapedobacter sp. 10938]|uniref:sugar phosphate isomerase/epimerase family protein n=1 Tax=Parapedobacter flavus TaxID=3110225 RepID=UPI002DBCF629|nr:sugar phosphate isomerase/epimerase [Parapedobacter sp. 10938]MEC3878824.1 sugar phosphate isomerase/epimerase [Parapedobacter sp. 10938]